MLVLVVSLLGGHGGRRGRGHGRRPVVDVSRNFVVMTVEGKETGSFFGT